MTFANIEELAFAKVNHFYDAPSRKENFRKSLFDSFRIIGNHHFRNSIISTIGKSTVLKSIIFLTFDINEIDAFQKVIIFEESETLPGVKTFSGVQKVYVLKTSTFRKSIKKYMNS